MTVSCYKSNNQSQKCQLSTGFDSDTSWWGTVSVISFCLDVYQKNTLVEQFLHVHFSNLMGFKTTFFESIASVELPRPLWTRGASGVVAETATTGKWFVETGAPSTRTKYERVRHNTNYAWLPMTHDLYTVITDAGIILSREVKDKPIVFDGCRKASRF